jgi:hypothetical protein
MALTRAQIEIAMKHCEKSFKDSLLYGMSGCVINVDKDEKIRVVWLKAVEFYQPASVVNEKGSEEAGAIY